MNLQNVPKIHPGRVCRFHVGQFVNVLRGGLRIYGTRVTEVASDPVDAPGFSHCSGTSAKYHVLGYDGWVYDWMLEALLEPSRVPGIGTAKQCLSCHKYYDMRACPYCAVMDGKEVPL